MQIAAESDVQLAREAESPTPSRVGAPRVHIQPARGLVALGLRDLWEYRELLYFLLWREVKGRYRQMAFGPLWILIAPLIQMLVFSVIFGQFANLPSDGVPYPLFTYVALLPWQFFQTATQQSAASLLSQREVISKVYFPRLIIPLAAMLSALVDFLASLVILAGMMIAYGVSPSWAMLAMPLYLLLAAIVGLGLGLWLAGLAAKFHDVTLGLGFLLNVYKFLTPVAYSAALIPPRWQALYRLNPMTVVVEGFRWSLLGVGQPHGLVTAIVAVGALLLLVSGAYYFRWSERSIVDVI